MAQFKTKHGEIYTNTQGFFGTYYKDINEKQHKFNKFNGYGFSLYELDEMKKKMVNKVVLRVTTKEGNLISLKTNYETILKHGETYNNNTDSQLILALEYFVIASK